MRMQRALQDGVGPELWGISLSQLWELRKEMRLVYAALEEDPEVQTMRDVVRDLIQPKTLPHGVGYALWRNRDAPLRATIMVSHSWDAYFGEFVDALTVASSKIGNDDGLWICSLSMLQKTGDHNDGPGPTLEEQLGPNVLEGPFAQVVRQARLMLVVQTPKVPVYGRLWCVWELYEAIRSNIEVRLLGFWTYKGSRSLDPRKAVCEDPRDATRIATSIEETCGWTEMERVILRYVKSIFATREEWPLIRPWEWKLLEAIRLDDANLVHQAAQHEAVCWRVRVGTGYGDACDPHHLYYLVMSFDQMLWRVGDTLLDTALLNGRTQAASAIAHYMDASHMDRLGEQVSADNPTRSIEATVTGAATRSKGPSTKRQWEWQILESIRTGNVALLEEAARNPDINWNVRISDKCGNAAEADHVYYMVWSFGLHWKVGHTLMDTAVLNGRESLAKIMESHGQAAGSSDRVRHVHWL